MRRVLAAAVTTALLTFSSVAVASASTWGAGITDEDYRCLNVGAVSPKEWWSECTTEDQ